MYRPIEAKNARVVQYIQKGAITFQIIVAFNPHLNRKLPRFPDRVENSIQKPNLKPRHSTGRKEKRKKKKEAWHEFFMFI